MKKLIGIVSILALVMVVGCKEKVGASSAAKADTTKTVVDTAKVTPTPVDTAKK
jgi:hypothetical protein